MQLPSILPPLPESTPTNFPLPPTTEVTITVTARMKLCVLLLIACASSALGKYVDWKDMRCTGSRAPHGICLIQRVGRVWLHCLRSV